MQVQVNIKFDELLKMVKQLPPSQLSKLKAEIEEPKPIGSNRDALKALLLSGPTFSKKQLDTIAKNRKSFSQWRTT